MKLVSINIRGLAGDIKWKYLRELIHKKKVGVLCVHETKLVSLDVAKSFSLWDSNDISWIHRGIDKKAGAF